jgi:hypothetical protein
MKAYEFIATCADAEISLAYCRDLGKWMDYDLLQLGGSRPLLRENALSIEGEVSEAGHWVATTVPHDERGAWVNVSGLAFDRFVIRRRGSANAK